MYAIVFKDLGEQTKRPYIATFMLPTGFANVYVDDVFWGADAVRLILHDNGEGGTESVAYVSVPKSALISVAPVGVLNILSPADIVEYTNEHNATMTLMSQRIRPLMPEDI